MKYGASLIVAATFLVASTAHAKCASYATQEWYVDADTVVLVAISHAQDGPVPYPYGLKKGTLPGRFLTLRVLKSWKGPLKIGDIVHGWARGPTIEDAYPRTDVGTKILAFFGKDFPQEIYSCNTVDPSRIAEVSAELDLIGPVQTPGRGS